MGHESCVRGSAVPDPQLMADDVASGAAELWALEGLHRQALSSAGMVWTAVTVLATEQLSDGIASFLADQGAQGVELSSSDGGVRLTAYFPAPAPLDDLRRFCASLCDLFPGIGAPRIECEDIEEQAWAESWREHFSPLLLGERLFIHPPWVREHPSDRISIRIDPGMAFGTGHHPSTRGCLVLLERMLATAPARRVCDLGSGSGILAIAAARLGVREVWAVDVDADARRIASENAAANGVAGQVRVSEDWVDVPTRCDGVLANLFAQQLVDFAPDLATKLTPGGWVIGAGILCEEEAAVGDAWCRVGLQPHDRLQEDGWVALAWRRRGAETSR